MAAFGSRLGDFDRFGRGDRAGRHRRARGAALRRWHSRVQRLGTAGVGRRLDGSALGLGEGGLGRGSDSLVLDRYRVLSVALHCSGRFILDRSLRLVLRLRLRRRGGWRIRGPGISGGGGVVPHFP